MNRGFTFLEVLVAMLIFTMAAVTAASLVKGSVHATRESKEIAQATWLLQNVITDAESRLEAQGIDRACKEKTEGKFEAPNEKYRWIVQCYPIDFKLSETSARLAQQMAGDADVDTTKEDPTLKMVLNVGSEFLTRSTRELHVQVLWADGKRQRQVAATTHFMRYDQKPKFQ